MNKKLSLALALAIGCTAMAPSLANAFTFDFNATSTTGKPVVGRLELSWDPSSLTVTNDVGADGTLHQKTSGGNYVFGLAWDLTEQGGQLLYASNTQDNYFTVNTFLRPDGSSELTVATTEYSRFHSAYEDTSLSFTLTCACSSLYSAALSESNFAHYDQIKDGEAKRIETSFFPLPDGTSGTDIQTHVVNFSTTAVPEPTSVAMLLAGGLLVWGRRRLG